MSSIEERVKKIVAEQLGVKEDDVQESASFVEDLGADSLDTVELVMALEEEFETEIPDEEAEKITTVKLAIDYIKENGMIAEAYSPVGHGKILDNAEIADMATKYGVSVPQLCIRYTLQLGLLPLPKTGNPDHMRSNADVDFEISEADMEALKNAEPIKDYGDASVFPVYSGAA